MERGQVVRPRDVRQVQADTMSALLTDRLHRTPNQTSEVEEVGRLADRLWGRHKRDQI